MSSPVLDQLNLVVRDMERSVAFYRALGVALPEDAIWRTGSGAHHVVMRMPGGFELALDSYPLAESYNAGWRPASGDGSPTVIGFRLADAAAVDAAYARLVGLGHASVQPPYYTFWGARYAIVEDPDGNHVGVMGPTDDAHRGPPPAI